MTDRHCGVLCLPIPVDLFVTTVVPQYFSRGMVRNISGFPWLGEPCSYNHESITYCMYVCMSLNSKWKFADLSTTTSASSALSKFVHLKRQSVLVLRQCWLSNEWTHFKYLSNLFDYWTFPISCPRDFWVVHFIENCMNFCRRSSCECRCLVLQGSGSCHEANR